MTEALNRHNWLHSVLMRKLFSSFAPNSAYSCKSTYSTIKDSSGGRTFVFVCGYAHSGTEFQGGTCRPNFWKKGHTISFVPPIFVIKNNVVLQI